ncbi:hypothetical protein RBE51_21475 [Pseudomonas taiwanensis]|uniref:hypothetical protein n=1 Tax=Pseudomonas taiwanensis TaxID=470150 RepID=UPI0028DDC723|nr:hypothetical protein [Pseudomonas taiwanensis]MDT8925370.1 hypothetical protein [Pseudomonas taiwanensis]
MQTRIVGERIVINKFPKVTGDKKHFSVKGTFVDKKVTYAGWDERTIIEGEYDLKISQLLQPGLAIKATGYYILPLMPDGYGLLTIESIEPCERPRSEEHNQSGAQSDNPYLDWRNQQLVDINRAVDKFLSKHPEYFAQNQARWLELSEKLNDLNSFQPSARFEAYIAPPGLLEALVGQPVAKQFSTFLLELGEDVVTDRPKPKLHSVTLDKSPEP